MNISPMTHVNITVEPQPITQHDIEDWEAILLPDEREHLYRLQSDVKDARNSLAQGKGVPFDRKDVECLKAKARDRYTLNKKT